MTDRTAVVFDSSQLWLHSIQRILPAIGVDVLGGTASAEEAFLLVEENRPQLLIAGIEAGPAATDGLKCVKQARDRVPGLHVVVWSNVNEPRAIRAAFVAGATAYVLKTARPEDIMLAIRQTFERSVYLAKEWPLGEGVAHAAARKASEILTPREMEILRLAAEGHSNVQLAQMLWVTPQTVKFHLSNIYEKLNVANRTEASRWAHAHGVVDARGAPFA
jgi:DNA-binding NarL/FixJ family response regulator